MIVKEQVPGAAIATGINNKLAALGINDVRLFYDNGIIPNGMWAVVQIQGQSSNLILPKSYSETNLKPYILWWCKSEESKFRVPNETDLINIITVVKRAPSIWAAGEKRADHFDELDALKDQKHQDKFKEKIHTIAKPMKKALKEGRL